ncbi:hypothetical protein [Pseudovibrio sp. Tun.PSC04-5.I4]|uniref:hypothetical protein n=1 Tax=Pseudovibrio sp. Tun.PSC04-5.I4 TaxID=1798213 RepID=UPI000880064C|nr:hypothetical protein [Pseudovibrio sp. Tun.PSC04-5.I4]SDR01763.1 hypothetical protein SAMN04515695_2335 [Pseudovibrio sp. Tun.PSC04-5.I4]
MSTFLMLLGLSTYKIIAVLALGGAVLAFAVRIDPRIPKALSTLVCVALLCVSVWFSSAYHYDKQAELGRLNADLQALNRIAAAHERVSTQANAALLKRIEQVGDLQKQVTEYEVELERGGVSACPADDAYLKRMRAIRFGQAP